MNQQEKLAYILQEAFNYIGYTLITDEQGRILQIDRNYAGFLGVDPQKVLGQYVLDVVANSEIPRVLKTQKEEIGNVFMLSNGVPIINSRIPIFKDDTFVGVISTTLFHSLSHIEALNKEIEALTREKQEYERKLQQLEPCKNVFAKAIGQSPAIESVKRTITSVAGSDLPVLITGETGVGKEVFATALHHLSKRKEHRFVKINCAAIPPDLLESELFGYKAGSFSGASKEGKRGKLHLANHGTLLLDEIGDMPIQLQSKLLRVLQEQEIEPIGALEPEKIDVRVICSTNCNIQALIRDGKFRSDLYYRINTVELEIPPLACRRDDIGLLSTYFIDKINQKEGISISGIEEGALTLLQAYQWPGNVRELRHCIERACVEQAFGELTVENFGFKQALFQAPSTQAHTAQSLKQEAERAAMVQALTQCNGNRTQAAKTIAMSRAVFFRRMKEYNIQ